MPEISDFQRTNSEFANSEQKYPVKITSTRTLIFPPVKVYPRACPITNAIYFVINYKIWPVVSGNRAVVMVVSGGGIHISDTTYAGVYGFPLLRQCHRGTSMTSCVLLDRSTRCRGSVGVTSSRRHGELGVWNSRIKSCFWSYLWHRIQSTRQRPKPLLFIYSLESMIGALVRECKNLDIFRASYTKVMTAIYNLFCCVRVFLN
jgi:hypothetical protein